ncbi:CD109 antigen isoform X2, partial [Biomphalaria glabrata]
MAVNPNPNPNLLIRTHFVETSITFHTPVFLRGNYFISAPRNVVKGTTYDISVDILKQNIDNVTVEAILQDRGSYYESKDPKTLLTANGKFSP